MIMALTAALPLAAQVRHVTTVNPTTKQSYTEVYEFDYVDIQPQFPGGERGLINFINKTREYPYNAYKKRIQGRVLCSFVVGTDGIFMETHPEPARAKSDGANMLRLDLAEGVLEHLVAIRKTIMTF